MKLTKLTFRGGIALLLVVLLGCGSEAARRGEGVGGGAIATRPRASVRAVPEVAAEYASELGVELDRMTVTESGVRYFDIAEGAGAVAAPGHSVRVRYQGWLTDGTSFDGGVYPPPGGRPLILGTRSVIQGWDDGIPGMKVGGRRQLVIPPELGYGAGGAGNVIPPNATLVFEVELLETGN